MKKTYTALAQFWRHGLPVEKGADVTLTASEAKYLGHVLKEKTVEAPAAEVAPAAAEAEPAITYDIHTTEVDGEDKPAKRRK